GPSRRLEALARGQGPVHLEMRAVDRGSKGVDEGLVTLEGADRLPSLVVIRKRQRDIVLEPLHVGVFREIALADDRYGEQRIEMPLQLLLTHPPRRGRRGSDTVALHVLV